MTLRGTRRAAIHFAWACVLVMSRPALGHQFLQGRVELVVYPDKITLWASVPIEEVVVQLTLPVNNDGIVATQSDAYRDHGKYLLKHIFMSADEKPLAGKVVSVQEPDNNKFIPGEPSKEYVTYELEYSPAARPENIRVRQDILQEVDFTPGVPWQMMFIAGIHQDQLPGKENLLLDSTSTLSFTCDWSAAASQPATAQKATPKTPPEALKQPLPDREPQRRRFDFVAGVAVGIGIVTLLIFALARLRKPQSKK